MYANDNSLKEILIPGIGQYVINIFHSVRTAKPSVNHHWIFQPTCTLTTI